MREIKKEGEETGQIPSKPWTTEQYESLFQALSDAGFFSEPNATSPPKPVEPPVSSAPPKPPLP